MYEHVETFFFFFFKYFIIPCEKFGSPLRLGYGTAATRGALCAVFSCGQTTVCLPVFGIFNVRTAVDTSDCTMGWGRGWGWRWGGGGTDTVRESALKVDSGEERKSLAAPGTRTPVSIALGCSVGRSTS